MTALASLLALVIAGVARFVAGRAQLAWRPVT
jgi:hypothetical protein